MGEIWSHRSRKFPSAGDGSAGASFSACVQPLLLCRVRGGGTCAVCTQRGILSHFGARISVSSSKMPSASANWPVSFVNSASVITSCRFVMNCEVLERLLLDVRSCRLLRRLAFFEFAFGFHFSIAPLLLNEAD